MEQITVTDIVEALDRMNMRDLHTLINKIESRYDVKAVPSQPTSQSFTNAVVPQLEEKTEFTVLLKEVPADKKIAVIKEVRAITTLGLKESKELVEAAPVAVARDISLSDAETFKKQLEAAGATVELA
jgi:large subunit ribosomal protein L7/L12